jgi:hypothetical protein
MMKVFARIVVLAVLAAGLGGCGGVLIGDAGYTFKFKVDNDTNLSGFPKNIREVAFINGYRQNDDMLFWITQTIMPGPPRTTEQRVPGFTVEDEFDSARRKCGVRVTFDDGTVTFGWGSFGHNSKVLITVSYNYYYSRYIVGFSEENW